MRTTLNIEDDVLFAAKELAAKERSSAGSVISRLARKGLAAGKGGRALVRNGVPVFPAHSGELVSVEHVERLLEDDSE